MNKVVGDDKRTEDISNEDVSSLALSEDLEGLDKTFDPSLDLKSEQSFETEIDRHAQRFYGQGKLLLSGEYFVLDGAQALALPTKVGQSLHVKYSPSFEPVLYWKSFDVRGRLWLEARFEFWRFNCLDENPSSEVLMLQNVLRQVRKQNSHFLRDEVDVHVETHLGFPLDWGLGSSSTFIYNVAQWAYISPFELLFNTYGGSGYDIACAQSQGPILYSKHNADVNWQPVMFEPPFKNNLYFVYLGKKQNSRTAVEYYKSIETEHKSEIVERIGKITQRLTIVTTLEEFERLILEHENIISQNLDLPRAKTLYFDDFWGEVKSLGAWGGDFVMVTSQKSEGETKAYFNQKGFKVCLSYDELILDSSESSVEKTYGEGFNNVH